MNYVFVDCENVHAVDPAVFDQKSIHLTLLLGPRHTKLNVSLVERLVQHAANVQLVRLASSGKNALDFALAYYVGRAVAGDSAGFFHIVSMDKGFDPLVEHLRSRHVRAHRHDDFSGLTFARAAVPKAVVQETPVSRALEHLRKNSTARPKRKKTLISHLVALFGNKIAEDEVLNLVASLCQQGHLAIDEKGAVAYRL